MVPARFDAIRQNLVYNKAIVLSAKSSTLQRGADESNTSAAFGWKSCSRRPNTSPQQPNADETPALSIRRRRGYGRVYVDASTDNELRFRREWRHRCSARRRCDRCTRLPSAGEGKERRQQCTRNALGKGRGDPERPMLGGRKTDRAAPRPELHRSRRHRIGGGNDLAKARSGRITRAHITHRDQTKVFLHQRATGKRTQRERKGGPSPPHPANATSHRRPAVSVT